MKKCNALAKLLIAALVWAAALLIPQEAGAATVRSGVSGDITWSIDENGKLMLEGTGDYECTDYKDPPWCEYWSEITSAEVNITGIKSTKRMFYQCSCLTSLDLSNLDTRNVTVMWSMFSGCSGLTSLDLSNLDTRNVTNMGYMFHQCSGLTSLDLSNLDTRNVTDMGWMFDGCSGLTSLDLSNLDTRNVTDMGVDVLWLQRFDKLGFK